MWIKLFLVRILSIRTTYTRSFLAYRVFDIAFVKVSMSELPPRFKEQWRHNKRDFKGEPSRVSTPMARLNRYSNIEYRASLPSSWATYLPHVFRILLDSETSIADFLRINLCRDCHHARFETWLVLLSWTSALHDGSFIPLFCPHFTVYAKWLLYLLILNDTLICKTWHALCIWDRILPFLAAFVQRRFILLLK